MSAGAGAGHHDGPLHGMAESGSVSVATQRQESEVVVYLGTFTAGARTWLRRCCLAFERLLYAPREATP